MARTRPGRNGGDDCVPESPYTPKKGVVAEDRKEHSREDVQEEAVYRDMRMRILTVVGQKAQSDDLLVYELCSDRQDGFDSDRAYECGE